MDPLAALGIGLAGIIVGAILGFCSQMLQSRVAHKRQLELNQQAHKQQMERDEQAHYWKLEDERRERLRIRYMELLRAASRYQAIPFERRVGPTGENALERTQRIYTLLETVRRDCQDASLVLQLEDPNDQEILPLLAAIEMATFRYLESKEENEQTAGRQQIPHSAADLTARINEMNEDINTLIRRIAERLAIRPTALLENKAKASHES
jgi:hypothetical protein